MASRQSFVMRLYLVGILLVVLLGGLVAVLLERAIDGGDQATVVQGTLIFLCAALVGQLKSPRWSIT